MNAIAAAGNEEPYDPLAVIAKLESDVMLIDKVTPENEAAANALVNREIEVRQTLDRMRVTETAPHLEAQRTINGFYNPLIARGQEAIKTLRAKINDYIEAERLRREAEARVAYEAAIKAEEEAVETDNPFDEFEKTEAARKAAAVANSAHQMTKAKVAVRGGGGRAVAQKTSYHVHLDGDGGDLVGHFASHEDVIELCRSKAERIVRAAKGNASGIPGIRVETRRGV